MVKICLKRFLDHNVTKAPVDQKDRFCHIYGSKKKEKVLATCQLLQLPQILLVSIAWQSSEQNFHKEKKKSVIVLVNIE